MSRSWWTLARLLGGVAILAALIRRPGTGPFLDAISRIDGWSLVAACGIALVTTTCCAWRRRLRRRADGVRTLEPDADGRPGTHVPKNNTYRRTTTYRITTRYRRTTTYRRTAFQRR